MFDEKFRSKFFVWKKENDFLIKIQIWFGFLNVGRKTDFYFENTNFLMKNEI